MVISEIDRDSRLRPYPVFSVPCRANRPAIPECARMLATATPWVEGISHRREIATAMPTTLYTLGYQQRSIEDFIELLVANRIGVLIDVRETAWSHKPGFSKTGLIRELNANGIEYCHASFAGNPKWLRREAASHRECLDWYSWYLDQFEEIVQGFARLVDDLSARGQRVCITCFERHAGDCHRSILADRWAGNGARRVRHLATSGCRRLVV